MLSVSPPSLDGAEIPGSLPRTTRDGRTFKK
jgi:hypothetical protein